MHVLDHLTQEHRKAEALLAQLADSEAGPERDRVLGELEDALTVHMAVEEMFVYPVAAETLDDDEKVQEADAEHELARNGLEQLRRLAAEPGFGAAVDMMTAGIGHHVREEESELFPELRRRAADQLDALDPEALEQEAKQSGPGRSRRKGSRSRGDGPSRDELYAKAQKAGIPGRSQMTKRELEAALRRAS